VCVCVCVFVFLSAPVCEMLCVNTRVNKIDLQGCNVTDKGFDILVPAHWPHNPPSTLLQYSREAACQRTHARVLTWKVASIGTQLQQLPRERTHVLGLQVKSLISREIKVKELYMSRNGITDQISGDLFASDGA